MIFSLYATGITFASEIRSHATNSPLLLRRRRSEEERMIDAISTPEQAQGRSNATDGQDRPATITHRIFGDQRKIAKHNSVS